MGEQLQNANLATTTALAMIEYSLKVFTAIYGRVHRALKQDSNSSIAANPAKDRG
jgi:hypothetical protein